MAKESDANKIHTTSSQFDDVTKHFSAYLITTESMCNTSFFNLCFNVMSIVETEKYNLIADATEITFAFLPSIITVVPCHILVKLDLQAFEVKEILCKNS